MGSVDDDLVETRPAAPAVVTCAHRFAGERGPCPHLPAPESTLCVWHNVLVDKGDAYVARLVAQADTLRDVGGENSDETAGAALAGERLLALAHDYEELAWQADFSFLYHRKRHLFAVSDRVHETGRPHPKMSGRALGDAL